MRFTVTASPELEDKLSLIWVEASDRSAVALASDAIDHILRNSPLDQGDDHGSFRVVTVKPLTVAFTVSPADCLVTIKDFIYEP